MKRKHVYWNLFNSDYDGEIEAFGDTVRISAIGDPTISDYAKDTDIASPESLTDAQTVLTISQAKYYNFLVDDVDKAQSKPKVMTEAMTRAAYKVANTMDTYAAGFYTDAISANLIGSSGTPEVVSRATEANIGGGDTVYDYLVVLSQRLNEQDIPDEGRWCVIPPWVKTFLTQDVRFTSFNTPQARLTILSGKLDASGGMAANAYLGKIENMDVYWSNNAPHVGGTVGVAGSQDVVLAGHSMALTKAEALKKTEAYRPERRFGDAVKGLCLYGAKTTRPYGIAVAYLQHP